MAQAGWYPDPEGSDRPRYWNGSSWDDLPEDSSPRRNTLIALAVGLAAVLVVVGVIVVQPWSGNPWGGSPEDTRSARPEGSQWDERPQTTPPTEEPQPTDGGRPAECPIEENPTIIRQEGGWYHSGRMKFRGVPGWRDDGGWTIDFADERGGQTDSVTGTWVSVTAIGQLRTATGYSNYPQAAAQQMIDCMSSSYYYRALDHKEPLENRAFTTADGVNGWLIREEFWNVPGYDVKGDEVVVVVLDAGDNDRLTLFHSQAPIGDEGRKRQVAEALDSLARR